jgi:hypothetical protein
MELFKKIPFDYEGNLYEIRIQYQDNLINIVTFLNNYPANGFRYQIQIPRHVEIENILDEKHLDDFIEKAKRDIVENRWKIFTSLFE